MLAAIVRLAVQRRGLVIALALIAVAHGIDRLSRAELDIFPEFAGKRIIVQTEAPGLSTELVESLISLPIERTLAGLVGLQRLRSESIQGLSVVIAVFDDATDMYRDRQLVGERLATVASQLPAGTGPPVLVPLSSSSATVLTIGLTSHSRTAMELRDLVQWTVAPRLLSVPGVSDVNIFGGEQKQLQIQVSAEKLWRYGLDLNTVVGQARRTVTPRGIGFLENDNQRLGLQWVPGGDIDGALRDMVLLRGPQGNASLGDVAHIGAAPRPPFSAAQIMGQPGIVLMAIAQYGANTLTVSRRLEQALDEFQQLFARQDIRLYPKLFRPADYIVRSVHNLAGHLAIGAVLVVAVLYLFLADARAAMIAAVALPLSILGALTALLGSGINLNIMVLGGLAIALGEVVDDAIIDTENITRRLRINRASPQPLPSWQVVFQASLEVRGSVVYASFIIALVFVPLLTIGGIAGRLFAPLGFAYILAILMSLLIAMTVTPALCETLLSGPRSTRSGEPPLLRRLRPLYRRVLTRALPRSGLSVLCSAVLFAASLAALPGFGGQFLPALREGHYILHTASLPGTALNESLRVGHLLTERLREIPGIESVSQWAGRAERGADTYGTHYSEYEVRLSSQTADSGPAQQRVLAAIRDRLAEFPGLVFETNTFLTERLDETISGYTAPVVINLYGSDLARLDDKARELVTLLGTIEGAADIQLRSPPGTPLVEVRMHHDQLASWGLQPQDLIDNVEAAFAGATVGRYFVDQRAYDISVILEPAQRRDPGSLRDLPLKTADGTLLRLGQVAEIRQTGGRYNILHQNAQRVQTITCSLQGRDPAGFIAELKRRVFSELRFPPDIYPEFTGSSVEQGAARRALLTQALLAGTGVLLLIYVAIGNLRNSLLTLSNLPFSLAGGFAAAYLTGGTVSVGSTIGFITLFGITVRNSIMLISHYRHLVEVERHPWSLETAVRGAEERLPSILMTALVTGIAMLPIAIGSDSPGREIMGPMAAIIVGGLLSSTVLNLLVLPAVLWRWGQFGERRTPTIVR